MALQDKLNEHKANFEKNAPPEALEVMHRATADLRNSGILDRALKVGDTARNLNSKIPAANWFDQRISSRIV